MNENIKNMVEELKHEFPDLKEDIDLIIYDEPRRFNIFFQNNNHNIQAFK